MLKQGKSIWQRFWMRDSGVASIEFSMVFIPFIMSILFVAELCRIVYLSSTLDLVLAESGHIASISTSASNYEKYFSQEMNKRIKQKPLFSRDASVNVSILYCDSIDALTSPNFSSCIAGPPDNMPLAIYSIRIDYNPLFFIFPRDVAVRELSRRIVLIQEFQNKKQAGED